MGARKQGQLKNNKYKDKKLLERQGENKDLYPKCKMYVEKGVKRGVCDRLIHFKWEEITQQQVKKGNPDKIPYICGTDRYKIQEKTTTQGKAIYQQLIQENNSAQEKIKTMKKHY